MKSFLYNNPPLKLALNEDIIIIPETAPDESLIETLVISDIDLPIFYNNVTSQPNSAKTWKNFNFDIDFNQEIILTSNNLLQLSLNANSAIVNNSIKQGDTLTLNNLFVGTSSIFDFSGQYTVDTVSATNSMIYLDITSNQDFVSYGSGQLPLTIHGTSSTLLSNKSFI